MASTQVVRIAAPFAALGVTWVARRALEKAYRTTTGREAPTSTDPDVPLHTAVMWAIATASIVAVTNVVVDRWVGRTERAAIAESAV
jgi:hypothetical protein